MVSFPSPNMNCNKDHQPHGENLAISVTYQIYLLYLWHMRYICRICDISQLWIWRHPTLPARAVGSSASCPRPSWPSPWWTTTSSPRTTSAARPSCHSAQCQVEAKAKTWVQDFQEKSQGEKVLLSQVWSKVPRRWKTSTGWNLFTCLLCSRRGEVGLGLTYSLVPCLI